MAIRTFLLIALLVLLSRAYALDEKDRGIYFVVRSDGQVTSEAFRLFKGSESWTIQGRKPDGLG